jgi:NodT family efflux transporter outer membrane factor (OMF) lipoprotein
MKCPVVLLAAAAPLLLSCMVGPDYSKPSVPLTPAYKESAPDTQSAVDGWKIAQPSDQKHRGNWWEIFGDPQLNSLEEQVTVDNQDLKTAEARFREARAMISFNRSFQFPTISTAPSVASIRDSLHKPYTTSTMTTADFVLPFDLSWELDLWGRIRRMVAAARREAQATAADLEGARLSLHSELALDYFELRSADAQKKLLEDTVKAYTESLDLTLNRFQGGIAPKSDVAQAQTQLNTVSVQATDILVQRAQFEHAIAILVGKPPAAFSLPPAPLDLAPPTIPTGLPSELLERRPDIAASERRVAESNEQIGIARAAFFPTVTLNASAGFEGTSVANWFTWPSRFWSVGPSVLQTLFDAGRRRAASDAALANYDIAVAQYRQTTLLAFQQVEDNLAAIHLLAQEEEQQQRAVASAQESLQLFTNRYRGGVDSYLQVVTAQTIALANDRNSVDIQRRRLEASLLLIKALGGGWNVSNLPQF